MYFLNDPRAYRYTVVRHGLFNYTWSVYQNINTERRKTFRNRITGGWAPTKALASRAAERYIARRIERFTPKSKSSGEVVVDSGWDTGTTE